LAVRNSSGPRKPEWISPFKSLPFPCHDLESGAKS
jgi:hypothetical protein